MYLPERAFRNQAERVRVPVISLGGGGSPTPFGVAKKYRHQTETLADSLVG